VKTQSLANFILEREAIRRRRADGQKPPWTKDPILGTYRFCNVRREDDAVTKWLARNWRSAWRNDLPRSIALARLVNWPPTLGLLGYPDPFDAQRLIDGIHAAERRGKAWSSAYIVSTNGVPGDKAEYIIKQVVADIPGWSQFKGRTLASVWAELRQNRGMGSFIAAQVIADLKNTPGSPLEHAVDWWDWAAPGPGSLRGVHRYFEDRLFADSFLAQLHKIRAQVGPLVENKVGRLCMQDWQNVMCEADKYWRTQEGHGKPKAYYRPNPNFP
jgi:hypothetical protein